MKFSGTISRLRIALQFNVLATVTASIISVDVQNDSRATYYISLDGGGKDSLRNVGFQSHS